MLTNFSSANSIFGIDHYTFNSTPVSPILAGYHNVVHMPSQTTIVSNPTVVPGIGELFTYNPLFASNVNDSELYFQSGAGVLSQIPYCYSARITFPASAMGTAINLKNIIGNISGYLIFSLEGNYSAPASWFFGQILPNEFSVGGPSNFKKLVNPAYDLTGTINIQWSAGGNPTLQLVNNTAILQTVVYTVFYTYNNPATA